MHVRIAALGAEAVEFCRRAPPVVMIALQDDLPAGDGCHEGKIRFRLLQLQRPRHIAEQHRRILRPDDRQPLAELFDISDPASSEHVHRFVAAERQMQISDRPQRHYKSSLTACSIGLLFAERAVQRFSARRASGSADAGAPFFPELRSVLNALFFPVLRLRMSSRPS